MWRNQVLIQDAPSAPPCHLILASTAISGQALCPQSCPVQGTQLVLNSIFFFFCWAYFIIYQVTITCCGSKWNRKPRFHPPALHLESSSLSAAGPEDAGSGYVLCLHKRGWEQGASSCAHSQGPLDDYSGVSIHQLLIWAGDRKKFQCLKHPLIRVILTTRKCRREGREIIT